MQRNKTGPGCVFCLTLVELVCYSYDCVMLYVACSHLVIIVLLAFAYIRLPIGSQTVD